MTRNTRNGTVVLGYIAVAFAMQWLEAPPWLFAILCVAMVAFLLLAEPNE